MSMTLAGLGLSQFDEVLTADFSTVFRSPARAVSRPGNESCAWSTVISRSHEHGVVARSAPLYSNALMALLRSTMRLQVGQKSG